MYIYKWISIYTYAYQYFCICLCVRVYVYIHMYIYIHLYTYMCMLAHKHIHPHLYLSWWNCWLVRNCQRRLWRNYRYQREHQARISRVSPNTVNISMAYDSILEFVKAVSKFCIKFQSLWKNYRWEQRRLLGNMCRLYL